MVDLNVRGRKAVIVGGGAEAARRAEQLAGGGCSVRVVAESIVPRLRGMAGVEVAERRVAGAGEVLEPAPDIAIAATDDAALNAAILEGARERGILAYSADDPAGSGYTHAAVIEYGGGIRVAVSTGGQSPAVARDIRARVEGALEGVITAEDAGRARVQNTARRAARGAVPGQGRRRELLRRILEDPGVDRLIKDGRLEEAEERAVAILGGRA